MKVWIDQDLCTGDGLCEEIAPDVFTLLDDGLAYVKEGSKVFNAPGGADGLANIPDGQLDDTFGHQGIVLTDISGNGSYESSAGVALAPNGRIVLAGLTIEGGNSNIGVARYHGGFG